MYYLKKLNLLFTISLQIQLEFLKFVRIDIFHVLCRCPHDLQCVYINAGFKNITNMTIT